MTTNSKKVWNINKPKDYISKEKNPYVRSNTYFQTLKVQHVEGKIPSAPTFVCQLSTPMELGLVLDVKIKLRKNVQKLCKVIRAPTQLKTSLTDITKEEWEELMERKISREHVGSLEIVDDDNENVRFQSRQYFLWDQDGKLWRANRDHTKYISQHFPMPEWFVLRNKTLVLDWKKVSRYNNRIQDENGQWQCIEFDPVYCKAAGLKISCPVHRHTVAICEEMGCHRMVDDDSLKRKEPPSENIDDGQVKFAKLSHDSEEMQVWKTLREKHHFVGSSFESLKPVIEAWQNIVAEAKVCGIQLAQSHKSTFTTLIQSLVRCKTLDDVLALVSDEAAHLFILGLTLSSPQTLLETSLIRPEWSRE